jgi:hypothetical protein
MCERFGQGWQTHLEESLETLLGLVVEAARATAVVKQELVVAVAHQHPRSPQHPQSRVTAVFPTEDDFRLSLRLNDGTKHLAVLNGGSSLLSLRGVGSVKGTSLGRRGCQTLTGGKTGPHANGDKLTRGRQP